MAVEFSSADIKVGVLAFFLVASIGGLAVATAEPHQEPPPRPIPKELLDKCVSHPLPGLCIEIELIKDELGQ